MKFTQIFFPIIISLLIAVSCGVLYGGTYQNESISQHLYNFQYEVLVVDSGTNRPIPGVTVRVANYSQTINSNLGENKTTGQTNGKGIILFTGRAYPGSRPASVVVAEISCPGYKSPQRVKESCNGTVAGKFIPGTCRQMTTSQPKNGCVIRLERN